MNAKSNIVVCLLFVCSLVCLRHEAACAQDTKPRLKVVEHIWGFDGRVQPGQFNPLSVLLDNQTSEPIEATATLQQIQGLLNATGGRATESVFIAPTARKWVQFYPYVTNSQQARKTTDTAALLPGV